MSRKNDIQVIINDKVYILSGYESESYLQQVARYMNGKISEFKQTDNYNRLSSEYQSLMLSLNIADDYFNAKNRADQLENKINDLEKQMYDMKHELVELQIKYESAQNLALEYKDKFTSVQKNVIQQVKYDETTE